MGERYGIAIYDDDRNGFDYTCNDKEFMDKFSKILNDFYNKYDGKIKVEKMKKTGENTYEHISYAE